MIPSIPPTLIAIVVALVVGAGAAVKRYTEAEVIMRLLAARLEFMTGLSVWPQFGKGWARRIAQNLRYGGGDLP